MTLKAPPIDTRSFDDLVDKTAELAERYTSSVDPQTYPLSGEILDEDVVDPQNDQVIATAGTLIDDDLADRLKHLPGLSSVRLRDKGWKRDPNESDLGLALLHIFGRMAHSVVRSLNETPRRNFRAFLDLIGTRRHPPLPARVPLTFELASGVSDGKTARVPAGTKASASPQNGESKEIIFETEDDLELTSSQLRWVHVLEPSNDSFGVYTDQATSEDRQAFPAFNGEQLLEHSLYLARDDIFGMPGDKKVIFRALNPQTFLNLEIRWWYWDGYDWGPMASELVIGPNEWTVILRNAPIPVPRECFSIEALWIRGTTSVALPSDGSQLPEISGITVQNLASRDVNTNGITPDQAFTNSATLDLGAAFHPWGEKPSLDDSLYLASVEGFSRAGGTVELSFTLVNANPDKEMPNWDEKPEPYHKVYPSVDLQLAWEVWTGGDWHLVGRSSYQSSPTSGSANQFSDGTNALTEDGKVTLPFPWAIGAGTFHNVDSFWLRVRIVRGNYGKEAHYDYEQETWAPPTFAPPVINGISIGYQPTNSVPLSHCGARNGFTASNFTEKARPDETTFRPYVPIEETEPTLHLGVDKPFDNQPVTLYVSAEPRSASPDLELVWEYSTATGWRALQVADETAGFTRRGLVRFVGPPDLDKRIEFDREACWLRVRLKEGEYSESPRLALVPLNTVWADQTTTVRNESIGSGTGERGRTFGTLKQPVLASPCLEVREAEGTSARERRASEPLGQKATVASNGIGQGRKDFWVQWAQVDDFYESGPEDRHYMLDHFTGEIRFGDGIYGMVPPRGANNIRASYKTGGGVQGNVAAGTITQLKSAVPYINSVTNFEPASGGADEETLEQMEERGPRRLRHRHRAVTVEDYEDLSRCASPEVARAFAIGAKRPEGAGKVPEGAGKVKVAIVPQSGDPVPRLAPALRHQIEVYLRDRCPANLDPKRVKVIEPDWIEVTISATLVATPFDKASLVKDRVAQQLQNFLHPLKGGSEGKGWPFGRAPRASDLYACIHAVEGVDSVSILNSMFRRGTEEINAEDLKEISLIFSGPHAITVGG